MDANQNGHFFDAKDRIIVSAAGTTAMLDHKCKIVGISKDNDVAEKIKRASLGVDVSKLLTSDTSGVD